MTNISRRDFIRWISAVVATAGSAAFYNCGPNIPYLTKKRPEIIGSRYHKPNYIKYIEDDSKITVNAFYVKWEVLLGPNKEINGYRRIGKEVVIEDLDKNGKIDLVTIKRHVDFKETAGALWGADGTDMMFYYNPKSKNKSLDVIINSTRCEKLSKEALEYYSFLFEQRVETHKRYERNRNSNFK